MSKKEKYINFIVDDLVKNTSVTSPENGEGWGYTVKFPWERQDIGTDYVNINFVLDEINVDFLTFMENRYGTTSDDGMNVMVKYAQLLEKRYGE